MGIFALSLLKTFDFDKFYFLWVFSNSEIAILNINRLLTTWEMSLLMSIIVRLIVSVRLLDRTLIALFYMFRQMKAGMRLAHLYCYSVYSQKMLFLWKILLYSQSSKRIRVWINNLSFNVRIDYLLIVVPSFFEFINYFI